jgi:two-component system sensor histidine kinase KdpD
MAASVAGVGVITVVYATVVPVNPTTVTMTYLVLVLLVATQWELAEAIAASVAATVCFNVFFLPPVGEVTIADPQNWVSFVAFMVTALIASQLSARARHRTVEALARQGDLERLYALSRALLLSDASASPSSGIAQRIAAIFDAAAVGVLDNRLGTVVWGGRDEARQLETALREVGRQGTTILQPDGTVVTAIRLGGAPIGALAIAGAGFSDTVLQSVSNLVAIALERARGQEAAARAEAARASSELRATVLDAVAHELKTPLTSMKAAASDLVSRLPGADPARELAVIIDEDLDRLQAVVTDAVRMLRIDAGDFTLHVERLPLAAVVESAVRDFRPQLDGHEFVNHVPPDLLVNADRELLRLAFAQLIDNAVKYSPRTSRIEVAAVEDDGVSVAFTNSGPVIPDAERARLFDRFYRGTHAGHTTGTGMGLSIVRQIAEAHGGSVAVSSSPGTGTVFTLLLPKGAAS